MLKSKANPDVAGKTAGVTVTIERMTEHDLLEVVEIEESARLSPWGWNAYHLELQSQIDSIMLVARCSGAEACSIAGFIVARRLADELHVNNFAVKPDFRRQRIGQRLLRAVLSWGTANRLTHAVLEVRAGNSAAQELYRTCGFEVVGTRRRYYRDPVEDALLMTVSLKSQP